MCSPMEKINEEVACLATLASISKSVHPVNSSEFTARSGAGIPDDHGSRPRMTYKCVKGCHSLDTMPHTLNGGVKSEYGAKFESLICHGCDL